MQRGWSIRASRFRGCGVALVAAMLLSGCGVFTYQADRDGYAQSRCDGVPENATRLRKAVAVTEFRLAPGAGADDLWDVGRLFAERVADALEQSGRVHLREPSAPPLPRPGRETATPVRATGAASAAQVVISGELQDLSIRDPAVDLPWFGARRLVTTQRRRLVVQLEVYDAHTGSLLGRHLHEGDVGGDNRHRGGRLGHGFWSSRYGGAMAAAADELTGDALATLRCLPLEAPVRHVDGERVVIEAGEYAGLQTGDELLVLSTHARRPGDPVEPLVDAWPLGGARVDRVSGGHAVLLLDPDAMGVIRIGDRVRAW